MAQGASSSATCVPCALGSYSAAGASSCTPCPSGTFGQAAGQGTLALACANLAGKCAPGQFGPLGATSPAGASCEDCPAGFTSLQPGAGACGACADRNALVLSGLAGLDPAAAHDGRALQEPFVSHTVAWLDDAARAIALSITSATKNAQSTGSLFKEKQKLLLKEKSHGFPPVTQFQLA